MRKSTFRPLRAAGALIATFGLVFVLGACGSDEPDATDETSSSSAPSASEEPAVSEEPAASDEPTTEEVSDEIRTFCAEGDAFLEADEAEGENPMSGFKEMFEQVTPPEELKEDWEFLTAWAADTFDALESVDSTDTEAMMELETELEKEYSQERVAEATENVDTFISEHCVG